MKAFQPMPLLTASQMRACDAAAIKGGEPSQTLMERAARGALQILCDAPEISLHRRHRLVVLCGGGNNGGDGFAMARFAKETGYEVVACYAGENSVPDLSKSMQPECARQYSLWTEAGGETLTALPIIDHTRDILIDALLGIGLKSAPRPEMAEWIRAANGSGARILSVDLPSGVNADTGDVPGETIHATLTVTIAYPKIGLLLYPAAAHVGRLAVCPIGVTTKALETESAPRAFYLRPEDLGVLYPRPAYANKGTFGRVLVIGGASGMCGAAYFAAKSAYRAGAGLVEILTCPDNRIPLQTLLPEAVLTLPPEGQDNALLTAALERADAVVLGCGLGQSDTAAALVSAVLGQCHKPLVLDADALNLLAASASLRDELLRNRTAPLVLTPHLGEASRLSGLPITSLTADLPQSARLLAQKYHAVCVLKDARTVVADEERFYIQNRGNSGMATGGSGDCLAGIVASLLAQYRAQTDLNPTSLAALATLLHAMAGDDASERLGAPAVMASDIADSIGAVIRALTH